MSYLYFNFWKTLLEMGDKMNDRDIEDTRQPPDYPEVNQDELLDQIYDYLPKHLAEWLDTEFYARNKIQKKYVQLYHEAQRKLNRIVKLCEVGMPTPESIISIAKGKDE